MSKKLSAGTKKFVFYATKIALKYEFLCQKHVCDESLHNLYIWETHYLRGFTPKTGVQKSFFAKTAKRGLNMVLETQKRHKTFGST